LFLVFLGLNLVLQLNDTREARGVFFGIEVMQTIRTGLLKSGKVIFTVMNQDIGMLPLQ